MRAVYEEVVRRKASYRELADIDESNYHGGQSERSPGGWVAGLPYIELGSPEEVMNNQGRRFWISIGLTEHGLGDDGRVFEPAERVLVHSLGLYLTLVASGNLSPGLRQQLIEIIRARAVVFDQTPETP